MVPVVPGTGTMKASSSTLMVIDSSSPCRHALVLHAAKFDKGGHALPQKVAVLERRETVRRVDRQWRDGRVGAGFIEERYRIALDAGAHHAMLGRADSTRGPLLEHLTEVHHQ